MIPGLIGAMETVGIMAGTEDLIHGHVLADGGISIQLVSQSACQPARAWAANPELGGGHKPSQLTR